MRYLILIIVLLSCFNLNAQKMNNKHSKLGYMFINETQIVTTCNAQIVFEGGGDYIQWEPDTLSVFDPKYSLQYPDNTPYIVYNNLGQIVKKGVLRRNVVLKFDLPKGIYYIRPNNYKAKGFVLSE